MRASFPPYTKTEPKPEGAMSERESKLRTLKHYLYHAGLIADELIAEEVEKRRTDLIRN